MLLHRIATVTWVGFQKIHDRLQARIYSYLANNNALNYGSFPFPINIYVPCPRCPQYIHSNTLIPQKLLECECALSELRNRLMSLTTEGYLSGGANPHTPALCRTAERWPMCPPAPHSRAHVAPGSLTHTNKIPLPPAISRAHPPRSPAGPFEPKSKFSIISQIKVKISQNQLKTQLLPCSQSQTNHNGAVVQAVINQHNMTYVPLSWGALHVRNGDVVARLAVVTSQSSSLHFVTQSVSEHRLASQRQRLSDEWVGLGVESQRTNNTNKKNERELKRGIRSVHSCLRVVHLNWFVRERPITSLYMSFLFFMSLRRHRSTTLSNQCTNKRQHSILVGILRRKSKS